MRILMTADAVGGVWTFALELAGALPSHEFILATMGPAPSQQRRAEAARHGNLRLVESCFRLEWMDDPWAEVDAAGDWLLELESRFQPDVIHLNGYAHAALPWRAPVLVAAHSCVLSWWKAVRRGPVPERYATYHKRTTRGLRCAGLVVAPTAAMLAALTEHYGPVPHQRVIPNGRNPAAFMPREKTASIFAAGRIWDDAKNITALARIAPGLPWPVMVAGDAAHPEGAHREFPAVQTLGPLHASELARHLGAAPIFAAPARYEPFGLAILEAALCECALVLGDIPSLRETWDGCALFTSPDDPDALASALHTLIRNDSLRTGLGRRARRRAGQYTPAAMGAEYVDAYRNLIP